MNGRAARGDRAVFLLLGMLALLLLAACEPAPSLEGNTVRYEFRELSGDIRCRIRVNAWDLREGDTLRVDYDFDLDIHEGYREPLRDVDGIYVAFSGERVHDEAGVYRQMSNTLKSTYLTPSGLPIENYHGPVPASGIGNIYSSPIEHARLFPLDGSSLPRHLHLSGEFSRPLDDSVPPGYYSLRFDLYVRSEEAGIKPWGAAPFLKRNDPAMFNNTLFDFRYFSRFAKTLYPKRATPLLRIGEPAPPRMIWVLFPEVNSNGTAGTVAREDREHFALTSRFRFPARLIMEPGPRHIAPCFIHSFPLAGEYERMRVVSMELEDPPDFLDYGRGEARVRVTGPDGRVTDLGTRAFAGRGDFGPKLRGGAFEFPFDRYGRYEVEMRGHVFDLLGRRYEGGGTYEVFVGKMLTFSTSAKPGTCFIQGERYPPKVEINPGFPAEVTETIRFFPRSDTRRERTVVIRGRANPYGYFFPGPDAPGMVFDEPGEYWSEVFATYQTPDGALWYGSQVSGGVIEGTNSKVALHGLRTTGFGELDEADRNYGLKDRHVFHSQSSRALNLWDISGCHDMNVPFFSGDILFYPTTYNDWSNLNGYLSLEPRDPALRRRLVEALKPTPLFARSPAKMPDLFTPNFFIDTSFLVRDEPGSDMFPILPLNSDGSIPQCFPEKNEVIAYFYFTALRPGFLPMAVVSDSTSVGTYWGTSPNEFFAQFSAGRNGDMIDDVYRFQGGLVYRDLKHDIAEYAAYASTMVMVPEGDFRVHLAAFGEAPLLYSNGRPLYLFLALATTQILEVGDRIGLGAEVFPPVPANVRISLTWPDGERTEVVEGRANRIGIFASPKGVVTLDQPGVYRARAVGEYDGKTGDVVGSRQGEYYHYVVEPDHPKILRIDRSGLDSFTPEKALYLPIEVDPGYTEPVLTYSVICPGIIMDEGRLALPERRHVFRFLASQFAEQFPNFDPTDYRFGGRVLNDTVVFVFFLEAKDPQGRVVHDVEKIVLRGAPRRE